MAMEKTGELVTGRTPCNKCGRPSEATHNGEAYCMTHYIEAVDPKGATLSKQAFAAAMAERGGGQ